MPFVLDATDRRILAVLQQDAGLSNVALAERVGLSPSPCLVRVRALERAGIIARRVALLDAGALGPNLSVFIQIALDRQTKPRLDAFESAITALPEVMECYLMTGDSDYLIRVMVRDATALQHLIVERLAKIEGIANIRSSFALKQVKYNTALPLDALSV